MVKRLKHIADHVSSLSPEVEDLTDEQLRAKTEEFRARYRDGETLDELLPEARGR
jgi:preprotein translocase subunit SecA